MTRIVDAHLHVWDRTVSDYAWITPELGPLDRSFSAEEARVVLAAAGVDGAILVQAEDSLADTRFLLDTARTHDWVDGVVGWLPLDAPYVARTALDEIAADPALRGIRHLVHDDPRDEFLDLREVRASLAELVRLGLVFEVPDAWPRHLAGARRVAEAVPGLTVVIDHLAKPPVGRADFDDWRREFDRVAELPNTVAKFSGLHLPGVALDGGVAGTLLEIALAGFGADRLMYGGDWPMSVPHGGYAPTWRVMRAAIDRITSPNERAAVLGGTAMRVYSRTNGATGRTD
ncbi:amidohydrolase family protein [Agromyces sp. NPDC058484]|uniref:amidohydrolase family protein n=1 Tax=Agromyces sp. NPDC058484 TaxID=3346524 RepID=UPI003653F4D0